MLTLRKCVAWTAVGLAVLWPLQPASAETQLGDLVDVGDSFDELGGVHFVAHRLAEFDAQTGKGSIEWRRYERQPSLSFNKIDAKLARAEGSEFPASEYPQDPALPMEVQVVGPRTFRIRISARAVQPAPSESLMLARRPSHSPDCEVEETAEEVVYSTPHGRLRIQRSPWRVTLEDASGRTLTRTRGLNDPASFSHATPFSFVRRGRDLARMFAAATSLRHDEQLFGCGESFTRLNKRGQRVVTMPRDAMGAQSQRMYKPVPFYLSSAGYGVFVHTSCPLSFDFGRDFDATNVAYVGDETLDLFYFVGSPQEVLGAYTELTGRSPELPRWSYGLWMSRITYNSAAEVLEVADKMREAKIPCDVIHLDTGWFDQDWQCDFRFSGERFPDPAGMISQINDQGFRLSLWQLPYFTPKNPLYEEAVAAGYFVKNQAGALPAEDGVLDFSNPETVAWYEEKLRGLLKLGVSVLKVDFGEDAPLEGLYASGRTGWCERSLYPLRYNRLVSNLTAEQIGERIIWARSAWAGSQRYPLHWGGDAENTYQAMAASMRAGLSLGMSGFTYWSHDAGGFVNSPDEALYERWLAMAAFSSHLRCHGAPPREPWLYSESFVERFRNIIEMRYRLLPYLLSEAAASSAAGLPMVRPLFLEHPDDPTSWLVEDQFLLGRNLLVAPLFDEGRSRRVYLPPGEWIDYQTHQTYAGGGWHEIVASQAPIVVLARGGSLLPHVAVAQHTDAVDWDQVEMVLFGDPADGAVASLRLPSGESATVRTEQRGDAGVLHAGVEPADAPVRVTLRRVAGASEGRVASLPPAP